MRQRIAVVGGGVSGLGAAWALHHRPDRFDFRLYEAREEIGGNAVTVDMPQDDGSSVPFDISVTAMIPSVYRHVLLLMEQFGIELVDTRFNYSVGYGGQAYAHDFDSELKEELRSEIARFQRLLRRLHWIGWLSRCQSKFLNVLNPFNYVSMRTVLDLGGFSEDFRYKILKPMFINFVLATNVYDLPAALFSRYLEFFDIQTATPMWTWDQGTRRIYENLSAGFQDKIYRNRRVSRVYREAAGVVIEDAQGVKETFDEVIFACGADQTLKILDRPTRLERYILSSIRYDSAIHGHAVVHWDSSVLPDDKMKALTTRTNHIEQYGTEPDNYEITYIIHNQQLWARRSDKPCLVTYNPVHPIDDDKIIKRYRFRHVVHDVRQVALLVYLFRFIQGRRRTWHCGAHTLVNSQETCFVTGLAAARQLGADYPFSDPAARRTFNYYGSILHGSRFRRA
ncbi:MAG: FAD-dependent oxidoreductase [bacterium]|nr:FAD-dependent oxidoreductase [bacterium]MDE0241221.1 FAD-dependent oxidoreductase [bacterium]